MRKVHYHPTKKDPNRFTTLLFSSKHTMLYIQISNIINYDIPMEQRWVYFVDDLLFLLLFKRKYSQVCAGLGWSYLHPCSTTLFYGTRAETLLSSNRGSGTVMHHPVGRRGGTIYLITRGRGVKNKIDYVKNDLKHQRISKVISFTTGIREFSKTTEKKCLTFWTKAIHFFQNSIFISAQIKQF